MSSECVESILEVERVESILECEVVPPAFFLFVDDDDNFFVDDDGNFFGF